MMWEINKTYKIVYVDEKGVETFYTATVTHTTDTHIAIKDKYGVNIILNVDSIAKSTEITDVQRVRL